MMRLLVSWGQSLSLLKPPSVGRLFLLAAQNARRVYRLFWTNGWALIAVWLFAAYMFYKAPNFTREVWQTVAQDFFWIISIVIVLFFCVLARSSTGQKDMAYLKSKAFIFFLIPVFYLVPLFLAPAFLLLPFFFLDTRGKIEDFVGSVLNAGMMVLHNLPIFAILIIGSFYILPLIISSRMGQLVAFLALPFLVALLMVIYQKRLYDDFSIYIIK